MADLTEAITPDVTAGHATAHVTVNKLVNSLPLLSSTDPQTSIDDVTERTDFSETLALRRLWITAGFVITTPLLVARAMQRLEGSSIGVLLSNSDSGEDLIHLNEDGLSDAIIGSSIERLSLKGTGTDSVGVYANFVEHLAMIEVNLIGHPGPAVSFESTNPLLQGVAFAYLRQVLAEPSQAVSAFIDNGGLFNRYQSCRAREAEVGFDFTNTDGNHLSDGYVESNNRGTAKTGVRGRTTSTQKPRHYLRVTNTYFENNPTHAIDVDSHTFTVVDGGRSTGGIDNAAKTAKETVLLNGGGVLRGFRGNNGTYLSAKRGVIRSEFSDGIVGRPDEVQFVGLMPPLDATGHNSASKSCFDSDPTWSVTGTSAPTLSYDTAVRFLGRGSKKAVFPSGGAGASFSRARVDNAALSLSVGDDYYTAVAFICDTAGECLRLRHIGGADGTICYAISDTVWQIALWSTANISTSGTYYVAIEPDVAMASSVSVWVGAVACSTNSALAFLNTEGRALDPGQINAQGLVLGQVGVLQGAGTPEAAVTADVGTLYLRTDGGAGTSMYVKETGTGNTGWVAK